MKNSFYFLNGEIYFNENKIKNVGNKIKIEKESEVLYCGDFIPKLGNLKIDEGSLIKLSIEKNDEWFTIEKKMYTDSVNILYKDLSNSVNEFKKELEGMIN